jgi:hypothetical protein
VQGATGLSHRQLLQQNLPNADYATILMGEVVLQQHETIVAPEHRISDKKSRDAKSPTLERAAYTCSHPFIDGATANSLTE